MFAFLDGIRVGRWSGLVASTVLLALFCVWASSEAGEPVRDALAVLERSTGGWLPTVLTSSALGGVVVVPVLLLVGRLRLRDVGLRREGLLPGLLAILALVLVAGLLRTSVDLLLGEDLAWRDGSTGKALLLRTHAFLGPALFEEAFMRGCLLVQLYLLGARRLRRGSALAVSLLATNLIFATMHLPNLVLAREVQASTLLPVLPLLFVSGLIDSGIFLVTRNLFFTAGVHALHNALNPFLFERENLFAWGLATFLVAYGWWFVRKVRTDASRRRAEPRAACSATP